MRHRSTLTWSQGLFGFRPTQNHQSTSRGQLQAKSACWLFSGEFTGSHTITCSQKIAHSIHHSFVKKCWVHSLRKCSEIPKNSRTLDLDSYGQYEGSQGKGNPREIGCFPIQTHGAATISPGYCTIPFFLFGWLKTQLEWRESNREDELYDVVYEIMTGLSIKMIETVSVDWMNRLQHLIDGNCDYVS
jgi:hypothetical protein